jgi:hypothetical protein
MGSVLSGILGTKNEFKADTGGQNFGQAINHAQSGINENTANQQTLAQALQAQANGTGVNPAQAMLHQATDNSIRQNSAMLASQKGINPGSTQRLVAMNAAQQGQQEAGQGALLQAQQGVSANGQLAGLYGQMGNQAQANLAGYQGALSSNNSINSGIAAANQASANQLTGMAATAIGGIGGKAATGGVGSSADTSQAMGIMSGGMSSAASLPASNPSNVSGGIMAAAHGAIVPGLANVKGDSPKNDVIPAMLSPGEAVIPRSKMTDPAKAKSFIDDMMGSKGSKDDAPSFGKIAALEARIKALEKRGKSK